MMPLTRIDDSHMFASNTSSVDVLPDFLQKMDEEEKGYILKDRVKGETPLDFEFQDKVEIAGFSVFGMTMGLCVGFSAGMAFAFGPCALGMTIGGVSGGSLAFGKSMYKNHEKSIDAVSEDRLVRLKRKVRVIDDIITKLSEQDKQIALTVKDTFNGTIERFVSYRSGQVYHKTMS